MAELSIPHDSLLEKLTCSICLDTFTMPLTIPCGHNFCQRCIHEHWDRERAAPYSCPDCRQTFPQRPEPCRNVNLCAVLEELHAERRPPAPAAERRAAGPGAACPRHGRALELFCCAEKRCVCCECAVRECRGHQLELVQHQRQQEEAQLSQALQVNGRHKEQTDADIATLEQLTQNIKASCDKVVSGIVAQFEQLSSALDECRALAVESVRSEERASVGQAEENLGKLQSRLDALEQHRLQAEQLLQRPDVEFLQGFYLLPAPGAPLFLPDIPFGGTVQVDAVTRILPDLTRLLRVELPNALHPEVSPAEDKAVPGSLPSASMKPALRRPPPAMSELRAKLCKEYRNLTFDPKTANKYIRLSRTYCGARHGTLPVEAATELPERFKTWQVLCTDGFAQGRHYWEVEVSEYFVYIGVAYGSLGRQTGEENKIGRNRSSWSLQLLKNRHSALHNGEEVKLRELKSQCVGVSLDWEAGRLDFYEVEDGRLTLLHSFSCLFCEALHPAFWIGEGACVTLCQLSESSDPPND